MFESAVSDGEMVAMELDVPGPETAKRAATMSGQTTIRMDRSGANLEGQKRMADAGSLLRASWCLVVPSRRSPWALEEKHVYQEGFER